MNNNEQNKKINLIQTSVFALILIVLFIFVCRLFYPFWTVILWSAVLYIIVSPLHNFVSGIIQLKGIKGVIVKNVIALLFALVIALIVLVPVALVLYKFFTQMTSLMHGARSFVISHPEFLNGLFEKIANFVSDMTGGHLAWQSADVETNINSFISSRLQTFIYYSTNLIKNAGAFIAGLSFMVFCLYFFFLDGKYLAGIFSNIPIKQEYIQFLIQKFKVTTKNLFLGYILVGIVQAVLSFIVYSIFKIEGAFVFACLTFVCVFIPILGGGLVWLPLGIARILTHGLASGLVFIAVSAVVISLLDNILRPYFLEDRIKLHPFIIFLSIIGGVARFGFNGIVIGPLIVIFFLTVLEMFLTEHEFEHNETSYRDSQSPRSTSG
ncbi:MAG: AI-2E family transporter [Spirochaetaceae bacterium]|jgi:predicted PurR-regulated permease PerM|nr:AI-2E family transporter [Spirochaetaceae bacterium]